MGNCLHPARGSRKKTRDVQLSPPKKSFSRKTSKENILASRYKGVEVEYELGRELGRGQFGITRLAVHKKTGMEFACKTLPKKYMTKNIDIENVGREVEILRHLSGHPHIVEYVEAFEDKEFVHLIMEFCKGGMLFDRITARGYYSEFEAAGIMRTIVEVIKHMHDSGVMHRDLKPENFLLSDNTEQAELKTIDFGLSVFYKPGQIFSELVGSAYYVAPEVLKRKYGPEVDIWSAGVILYILLCGVPPFWHFSEKGIMDAVLKGDVDLESDPWPTISEGAKDLVRKMLTYDPKDRITPEEVLEHEWIRVDGNAPRAPVCSSVHQRVRQFVKMDRFKRAAFHELAKHLPPEQFNTMRECWAKLDHEGTGSVTFETMKIGLHKLRASKNLPDIPDEEIRAIVHASDLDGNGALDYTEYFAAVMSKNDKVQKDEQLRGVFAHFDKNGDGAITIDELREVLVEEKVETSTSSLEEVFAAADRNKDGKVDFSEFAYMMRHGNGSDELESGHDMSKGPLEATNTLGLRHSTLPTGPSRTSLVKSGVGRSPRPSGGGLGIAN